MTTGSFISSGDRMYYEGDRAHRLDQAVPQKPSAIHVATFDGAGVFVSWVLDQTKVDAATRRQGFLDDVSRQQILSQLRSATNVQIENFVANQVVDLPSAKLMLTRILKVLALVADSIP